VPDPLSITFLLPALNETDSLRETVETILRVAVEHVHEIAIIVADRTLPETRAVAQELQSQGIRPIRIHQQQRPGIGGALQEGFALASGSHVMLMASDLETDPALVPEFIACMQEGRWDIVAGSRWLKGAGFDGYGYAKQGLNRLFQAGCRLLYGARLTDFTYAYRLYRRESLQGLRWEETGYAFLLECLLKPLRLGASVTEVPCRWRARREGRSGNSFGQMAHYASTAWRIRRMAREDLVAGGLAARATDR
jgi:glycosyltransferase involved in cell wall biosynthesis